MVNLLHSRLLRAMIATTLVAMAVAVAQTPQEIAETAFASTVTVLVYDEFGQPLGLGSGFVVADDHVITNAHVIAGATSLLVRPIAAPEALTVTALLRLDAEADLALLETPGLDRPALQARAEGAPAIGDTVFAVGSPLGLDGTFSQGIVSGYRTDGDANLMQITAPISPGSSGGPILDTRGQLVGVAIGTFTAGQNLNFAVPVTAMNAFLATPEDRQPVAAAQGLEGRQGESGAQLTDGVVAGVFTFGASGGYSFSVRNSLPRAVRNIEVVVVFFDGTGFPIETAAHRVRETILPGLGVRITGRVDSSVQVIMTGSIVATDLRSPVEIRVLGFEFAD